MSELTTELIQKDDMSVGLYEKHKYSVNLDEYKRDMQRLLDLRTKSNHPGLNTYEGNEAKDLRDKYDLSHLEWWSKDFLDD